MRIGWFFIDIEFLSASASHERLVKFSEKVDQLIVFHIKGEVKATFPQNVKFIKINVPNIRPRLLKCLYFILFKSIVLARKIRKLEIDAIYVLSDFWAQNITLVVSRIATKPLIIRLRGDDWVVRRIQLPRMGKYWKIFLPLMKIYDFFQTFSLKNSNHIISVSDYLKEKAIQQGIRKEKITTVRTGVNHNLFKPTRKKQMQKRFTLCSVVRLVRAKGIEYLIEAVRGQDVELIIIGYGEREYVEKLEKEAPKNVRFLGRIDYAKMPKYINHSDALILSSLSEGLPRTVLEAMACGKPVIATKVPGATEIGFKGWLIEPRNVKELRKAIIEASKTPKEILDNMGKMNRKIALTKFNWTITYDKIHQILQTVTKSNL